MAKFKSILPDDGSKNKLDETVRMSEEQRQQIERAIRDRQMERGQANSSRKARGQRSPRPITRSQKVSAASEGKTKTDQNRRRRPPKRNKSGQWLFIGVMAVLAIIIFTTASNLLEQGRKIEELEGQLREQNLAKDRLEESIAELENELNTVNTDEFIERYAHEKLGMVKPNELMYEVEPEGTNEEVNPESTEGESVEEEVEGPDALNEGVPVDEEALSEEESSVEGEQASEEEPVEEAPTE